MKQHRNTPCHCGSGLKLRNCHGITTLVPGTPDGPGGNRYGQAIREKAEYLHVLMPTRGTVTVETMNFIASLGWNHDSYASLGVARATLLFMPRRGVAEARELLAEGVVRGIEAQPDAKHWVLWIDDDACPDLNDIQTLLNELRRSPDLGVLSCFYSAKVEGHPGFVPHFPRGAGGHESALRTPGVDFMPHHIVEVPWVGLHCAMMRGEIFAELKTPRFPFDHATGLSEDVGFSHRVRAAGWKCAVHAGVMVAHIDADTGKRFVPDIGAKRLSASPMAPGTGAESLA